MATMMTRRRLLQTAVGAAAGLSAPNLVGCGDGPTGAKNLLVLITDQERYETHWPSGWSDAYLPAKKRLEHHGLTFNRAYAAACECSPSRGVMLTSEFAPMNGVARTLLPPGLATQNELANVATLLSRAGYDVVWKGKWHLSYAIDPGSTGENWQPADIAALREKYGFSGFLPPDSGNAVVRDQDSPFGGFFNGLTTLGGGIANNDGRYVDGLTGGVSPDIPIDQCPMGPTAGIDPEGIRDYLRRAATSPGPFCLFVSLVNPHDIGFYPVGWDCGGYVREDFDGLGIALPPNYDDTLETKPAVQRSYRAAYDAAAPLVGRSAALDYVNFYAHLHTVVDAEISKILDAMDALGLTDDTIVVRLADHGELGLSHGLREKSYTAYEEMIHVPLIVSNPTLYPQPRTTEAFYSHLDLLPTLAALAGIPESAVPGKGTSLLPVLNDPGASVQDAVLYSYDDVFFLDADSPGSHIRGLRHGDWTYAVYFADDGEGIAYELYDLASDPGQLDNLVFDSPPPDVRSEWAFLHDELTRRLVAADNLPTIAGGWPEDPARG